MTAHFRIQAFVDRARAGPAVVSIDRRTATITVRRLRSRKSYTLPLSLAADILVAKCIKAEVREKREGKSRRTKR